MGSAGASPSRVKCILAEWKQRNKCSGIEQRDLRRGLDWTMDFSILILAGSKATVWQNDEEITFLSSLAERQLPPSPSCQGGESAPR